MEKSKEFQGSRCSNYTNARHLNFHQLMYKHITAVFDSENGLQMQADLLPEYAENINKEVELNREARANIETVSQEGINQERDRGLSFIFNEIKNADNSLDPDYRVAGAALSVVIHDYLGIQNEPLDAKSGDITGLLKDLRKPENVVHVTTLGRTKDVDALEAKNNEYMEMRTQRAISRANESTEATKVIRHQTDTLFNMICKIILVMYMSEKDEAKEKTLSDLIDLMNQTIAEFKAGYNMEQAQKKAAKDKKDKK